MNEKVPSLYHEELQLQQKQRGFTNTQEPPAWESTCAAISDRGWGGGVLCADTLSIGAN
jgi:hypothetical protein